MKSIQNQALIIAICIVSLAIVIGIVFLGLQIRSNILLLQGIRKEKELLSTQVRFWENVARNYRGYRDGYFLLAVFSYRLQDKKKASVYLEKALDLDPNFKEGRELEALLTK